MIGIIFNALELIILIDCILSWVPIYGGTLGEIKEVLSKITGPLLEPFRQIQYKLSPNLPIDLSPIFAIIVFRFLERLIYSIVLGIL